MVFFYFANFMLFVDFRPVVVQGFEEKDSFGVAQFVSGSPPSVEVQGFVVLLAFQGHAEEV